MATEREDRIVGGAFDYIRLTKTARMPMICIYDHPTDYPSSYVARVWDANYPTHLVALADTLEEIRAKIPPNMTKLPPMKEDDPVIVEVWI